MSDDEVRALADVIAVWNHEDRLAARNEEGDPARDWAGDETYGSDER